MLGIFSSAKLVVIGIAVAAIAGIIGLAYWHYTGLLRDNHILTENNAKLETATVRQSETIDTQAAAIVEWKEARDDLVNKMEQMAAETRRARDDVNRLEQLFSQHDLVVLAARRPGLIQTRINDGTAAVLRLLECASRVGGEDCGDQGPASRPVPAGP